MPKRIIFHSTMGASSWGGSEELWSRVALRLREAGHFIAASIFEWNPAAKEVSALSTSGIKLHLRKRQRHWAVRGAEKLIYGEQDKSTFDWIQKLKPDLVIISQGGVLDGVPAMLSCRARALPYAAIAQANGEAHWPDDHAADNIREAYLGARRAYFVSRRNLDLLINQIGAELPNAELTCNPFKVAYRRTFAISPTPERLRLACVARLDPAAKGQDLLFRVLAREKWRNRALEVSLVGRGSCESTLKRLARLLNLESLTFAGHVENMESVWNSHDALVLPSRFEGTSLALIEAMLCARPAIVTEVGGNGDLVEDNVSGFVAKAPTEDLLDEAMERAWGRRADLPAIGIAARARVTSLVPEDPAADLANNLSRLCANAPEKRTS